MSELIAEARVLIRPDLTGFRTTLAAEVNAAVAATAIKPVVVPVTAGGVAGGAAAAAGDLRREQQLLSQGAVILAAAQEDVAASTQVAARATEELATAETAGFQSSRTAAEIEARRTEVLKAEAVAARSAAIAQEQLARANDIASVTERRVAATTTEIAAAQARYAASIRETTATFSAYEAALATSDFELRKQARDAFLAAKAQEALALETLNATRATEEQAAASAARNASLGQTAKGALSAAAAQAGLRGATLAAGSAFIAGAAAVIGFGKAIQSAAQFESTLNVFRVTAGATADEMARVGQEAQALGRDITLPGVGAQDAAEAMTELSKAGLSVQDSLDGARGVLQLATAAAISNADAVQIAASALNAFGLAGDQAVRVADVLTNASNLAQGSITDVGLSLQQAAAVARQVGLSFEDTVALITELQKAGIRGSDAGTSLRVSLIKLIAPSTKAAEVLDRLNVSIRDSAGNVRPDVFNQFAAAQENLTKKQQDANAAIVFGTDGLRAYSIISRQGLPALREVRQELDKQGSAAELAGARMTGLAGAAENLKNQLSALGLVIGQGVAPALTDFANSASSAIGGITSIVKAAGAALGPLAELRSKVIDLTKIPGTDISLLGSPILNAFKTVGALGNLVQDTGTDLKFARQNVKGLVIELNKVGGATKINETVLALQDLADHFKGGDKESQAFADSIEVLIKNIQKAGAEADGNPIKLNVVVPPEVSSGQVGADAAKATARGFNEQMKLGFGDLPGFIKDGLDAAKPLAEQAGSEAGKLFGAGFKGAVTIAVPEAAQSSLDLALAQASGNQTQELRVLIERRNRQQAFLNRVLARQPATQAEATRNTALATQAAKNLEQTKSDIQSIFDARAAATKQAAADAKSKADKAASDLAKAISAADQKVLDAITGADIRFERAVEIARAQGGPGALVKALEALQAQQQRDIDKAKATIKDAKTLRTTLRQLRQARFETGQDLIAAQQAQQDAIEESFQKRLTFAELQAQLTGNDTVLVKAINAYIKYLRTVALPAARKARKGVLDVKTEIERLLVQRKELARTVEGESPDVFAARLFQQAADQFRRFGSNITSSATGILSPQQARGTFAANLLGPTGQAQALTDTVAVRQRDTQLQESKKQTALLQVIARGPRREIRGVTVPRATQETVANIAANVLRGL